MPKKRGGKAETAPPEGVDPKAADTGGMAKRR